MSASKRGIANAFRNKTRAISTIIILGLGIGVTLSMLTANYAITNRIEEIKTTAATNLRICVESCQTDSQTNQLALEDIDKISTIPNIVETIPLLEIIANQKNTDLSKNINTNLQKTFAGVDDTGKELTNVKAFDVPIVIKAMNIPRDISHNSPEIISGNETFSSPTALEAFIREGVAEENSLKVGDTFILANETIKIISIFAGDVGDNDIYIPLAVGESVINQQGYVSKINVNINNIDNLSQVESDIMESLKNKNIVILSASTETQNAIQSLTGVKNLAFLSFVGSLFTAASVMFLMMVIAVKEKRKEIGILKAIGASKKNINIQFASESLTLVTVATLLGSVLAIINSQNIIRSLVGDSTKSSNDFYENVNATINLQTVTIGILGIVLIALIGSLVPVWLTTRIRPIEALRKQ